MAKSQPEGTTRPLTTQQGKPGGNSALTAAPIPKEPTVEIATTNKSTENIDAVEKTITDALKLPTLAKMREDYNNLSKADTTTERNNTWEQTKVDLPRQKITWQEDPSQEFQFNQEETHPIIHELTKFGLDETKHEQCLWACSQASVGPSMIKTGLQNLSSKVTDQDITLTPQQDKKSIQITNQRTFSLTHPDGDKPVINYTMCIMSTFHRDKGFTSVQESITGLKSENVAEMVNLTDEEKKEIKETQSANLSRIQAVQTAMAQQSLLEGLRNTQETSDQQAPINQETITQIVQLTQTRTQLTQAERALEDSYPNELRFAATLQKENQEWYDMQNIMSKEKKGTCPPTDEEKSQGIREVDKYNLVQLNKDGKRDFCNETVISWGDKKKIPLQTFLQKVSTAIDPKKEWTDPSENALDPNSKTPFLDLTSEHQRKMMHAFLPLLQTHTAIQTRQIQSLLPQGGMDSEILAQCIRDDKEAPKIHYSINSENKIVCKKTIPWLMTYRYSNAVNYARTQPFAYTEHLVFDKETSQWERTAQSIDLDKDPGYSRRSEEKDDILTQQEYIQELKNCLGPDVTFEDITSMIDPLQSKVKDTLQGFNDRRATEQKSATAERILANIANQPTPDPSQMTQLAQLTQEALTEASEQLQKTLEKMEEKSENLEKSLQEKTNEYDNACQKFNMKYQGYLEIVKNPPKTSQLQNLMLRLQDLLTRIYTVFQNDPWVSVLAQKQIIDQEKKNKRLTDSTHIISPKAMPQEKFTQALEETKKIAEMKKKTEALSLSIEKLKQDEPPKHANYINKIRAGHNATRSNINPPKQAKSYPTLSTKKRKTQNLQVTSSKSEIQERISLHHKQHERAKSCPTAKIERKQ